MLNPTERAKRALALLSGGLDSSLAVKLMIDQGITVTAVPTLALPDGRVHSGTLPAKQLIAFIQGKQ